MSFTPSPLLYPTLTQTHILTRAPRLRVVSDLMGLQAQFSRNPYFSLKLRASDWDEARWDEGLCKIWSFRSTMHVVCADEVGLYLSAMDMSGDYNDGWWGMSAEEQGEWAPFLLKEITAGNGTRDGLKRACREAGMSEELAQKAFYGWGGLIKEMVWRGMIVMGTGTDKRYRPAPPIQWMERDEARRLLVERYFTTFGPATLDDCGHFFGWKRGELMPIARAVVKELLRTEIEGKTFYHTMPLPVGELPECLLLPGFDQTVLAYKDRTRLIAPEHFREVVNMAGIVFPLIVLRGRARAKWKEEGGRIIITPMERLYKKDIAAIKRTAKRELGIREINCVWAKAKGGNLHSRPLPNRSV